MSILDNIDSTLAATPQATALQYCAATVNFDWPTVEPIFEKLQEEILELQEVIAQSPTNKKRLTEEMGDIIFACINISRKLNIDPEVALQTTNDKFRTRFAIVEKLAEKAQTSLSGMSLDDVEQLWQQAKENEHG